MLQPLCLPRKRVYRPPGSLSWGRAQDAAEPALNFHWEVGRELGLPPGCTQSHPSEGEDQCGKNSARLEREKGKPEAIPAVRARGGPSVRPAPVPVPSPPAQVAAELGPVTTSPKSVAFSPPLAGSLFLKNSLGYKIGLLLWPTSPSLPFADLTFVILFCEIFKAVRTCEALTGVCVRACVPADS